MLAPSLMMLSVAATLLFAAVANASVETSGAKSVATAIDNGLHKRYLASAAAEDSVSSVHQSGTLRRVLEDDDPECDSAFLQCVVNPQCVKCYLTLDNDDIDFAGVTSTTSCTDVVNLIQKSGRCLDMTDTTAFCATFEKCVDWDEEEEGDGESAPENDRMKCKELKKCEWDGFRPSFIGDGICHDNIPGCYNTAICGYDGGDCCHDTCDTARRGTSCGVDGYACRDPESAECDTSLTPKCPSSNDEDDDDDDEFYDDDDDDDDDSYEHNDDYNGCQYGKTAYALYMYDSFGDGWDLTNLALFETEDGTPDVLLFAGGLSRGSEGKASVCLANEKKCYKVVATGGVWGKEVSWEVKPAVGGPNVAFGGSPASCTFPVGETSNCENTCNRKPDPPENTEAYKSYKEMTECIAKTCLVQLGICEIDPNCSKCLVDQPESYCFANPSFNALTRCSSCNCVKDKKEDVKEFCEKNMGPGSDNSNKNRPGDAPICTPDQTAAGIGAAANFAQCASLDSLQIVNEDFDENNFGLLDSFEKCAHEYNDLKGQSGVDTERKAMDCMKLLVEAAENPTKDASEDADTKAIGALAGHIYEGGDAFCECANRVMKQSPTCRSFVRFKMLISETLDACHALDEVDCDAWAEFHKGCEPHLLEKFGSVDFSKEEQCKYIVEGCGDVGPFPAFRNLDCGASIGRESWAFYSNYERSCPKSFGPSPPTPIPPVPPTPVVPPTPPVIPSPTPPVPNPPVNPSTPSVSTPPPQPYKPVAPVVPVDPVKPTPYTPTQQEVSNEEKSAAAPKKRKRRGLRVFMTLLFLSVFGAVGFWYYKKRSDGFEFIRYRRARNYGFGYLGGADGGTEMLSGSSGVDMGGSTGSAGFFAPPTLPPPPSALEGAYS